MQYGWLLLCYHSCHLQWNRQCTVWVRSCKKAALSLSLLRWTLLISSEMGFRKVYTSHLSGPWEIIIPIGRRKRCLCCLLWLSASMKDPTACSLVRQPNRRSFHDATLQPKRMHERAARSRSLPEEWLWRGKGRKAGPPAHGGWANARPHVAGRWYDRLGVRRKEGERRSRRPWFPVLPVATRHRDGKGWRGRWWQKGGSVHGKTRTHSFVYSSLEKAVPSYINEIFVASNQWWID